MHLRPQMHLFSLVYSLFFCFLFVSRQRQGHVIHDIHNGVLFWLLRLTAIVCICSLQSSLYIFKSHWFAMYFLSNFLPICQTLVLIHVFVCAYFFAHSCPTFILVSLVFCIKSLHFSSKFVVIVNEFFFFLYHNLIMVNITYQFMFPRFASAVILSDCSHKWNFVIIADYAQFEIIWVNYCTVIKATFAYCSLYERNVARE